MCRLHRKEYQKFQAFREEIVNQLKEQEKKAKHEKFVTDLNKNLHRRKEADGTYSVSVFRSGAVTPPAERGVEKESYEQADTILPSGRQGRMNAVFASPSLGGVMRWVQGNDIFMNKADIQVRELRVNPDQVYVYSVKAWEKSSWHGPISEESQQKLHQDYWNTGITLTEWVDKARQDPNIDPTEWEILIPQTGIREIKPVSPLRAKKCVTNSESAAKRVEETLKKNARWLEWESN